jgi:hypothetical protein
MSSVICHPPAALPPDRLGKSSLIHFVCWVEHPDLRRARGGVVLRDQVQVHEGRWAYCSTGGKTDHVWEPIGPLTVDDVKLYERRRNETTE